MKLAEELKKAVLQAAMQGKLTEQLESDSNIFELLKSVEQTKKQLLERKEIKLEKFDDQVGDYDIPKNWAVVKLGTISGVITKQTGFDYTSHIKPFLVEEHKEDTIPMVQTKNFKGKKFDLETDYYIPLSIAENFPKIVLRGKCLLFSIVGASIGNVGLYDSDVLAMIGGAICKVSLIDPCFYDYLFYYLQSNEGYKQIMKNYKSTAQGTITVQDVREIDVLLPPIEEQQRIVEKLNQILPLIDEYGKEEDELIALCQKFPEEMKKSVLKAAMQGKLTEQLETDSSVDELLKKIADEKAKNNQVWKAKKQPPIDEILETIDANEIPDNWKWVKLSQIAHSYIGLTYSPSNVSSNGTIVLRSSNIQNGKMDYKDIVKVEMDIPENKMCKKGDILVCARNGSKSLVGKAAIIDADGMSFGAFMAIIKSPCNEFLYHYLSSPYFKKQMALDSSTVTVNQITQDMLFNACVPLPPI